MICEITSDRQLTPLEASGLDDMDNFIDNLGQADDTPHVTQGTAEAMKKSLAKYFQKTSESKIDQFTEKAKAAVEKTLKEAGGTNTAEARTALNKFLSESTGQNVAETMDMNFFLKVAREVAQGAGQYVSMNADPIRVDEYPAVELVRVYARRVPRGSTDRVGDDDWPTRFEAAGGELIDGRMVALKNDPVWQALGDGEGGYEDTLGNPYPPFAFQSGFDWDEVSREEAEELGLLDAGEEAEGADIDYGNLFSFEGARCLALRHSPSLDLGASRLRGGLLGRLNQKRLLAGQRQTRRSSLALAVEGGKRP